MFIHISTVLQIKLLKLLLLIRGGTPGEKFNKIYWIIRPVPFKVVLKKYLNYEWKITMQVKLIFADDKEFTNDKNELVRGFQLVFLNEQTGETFRHFVNNDNLKGFDPKQLCKITGKNLEISTNVKTYKGNSRIVLDKVVELVQ